ncbi:IS110 family transposase [Wenzhouxiangella marina]|uniref:Transposase IS116/IS110/IS902 family protein n=1 Tax=Wenzhouxiangella marina TaxID=1579979 RepID=A0A0K0XUF9_9GAMM|nr:IS110 family transposase [Wenzhouxiangella marina]AKS41257.1 Transposase IS116/IS110/IS902 family protein [Wenzhouxiangella marina]AKS43397.1 Transposase IS116/IS110/IS902 family protein [Wenzhouxiangella marina]
MNQSTLIAVDLAKEVFQVALARAQGKAYAHHRLSRTRFEAFLAKADRSIVLFEACGSAHFWCRQARELGHEPIMLPAQFVRKYRLRNKTDQTDTEALLDAYRSGRVHPVPVRSVDQQQIQQLHRVREQWKSTRVARINGLRGCLRELGHAIPAGPNAAKRHAQAIIDQEGFPAGLRAVFSELLQEITDLEAKITLAEQQIHALTRDNDEVSLLQQVPGVGLLTSTALVACAGSPDHFKSGRHFASWLGITPLECSSGNKRWLGRITKRGDKYLRMLIIHGARSALCRAKTLAKAGKPLNRLQRWALRLEQRVGFNKATVALANKMARICWAVWKQRAPFNPGPVLS